MQMRCVQSRHLPSRLRTSQAMAIRRSVLLRFQCLMTDSLPNACLCAYMTRQTYVVLRPHNIRSGSYSRKALFRFGNWCYEGEVRAAPTTAGLAVIVGIGTPMCCVQVDFGVDALHLGDVPDVLPALQKQQVMPAVLQPCAVLTHVAWSVPPDVHDQCCFTSDGLRRVWLPLLCGGIHAHLRCVKCRRATSRTRATRLRCRPLTNTRRS